MITIKILIDILLFSQMKSILYWTMHINDLDDCVNRIYVKENSTIEYFKFDGKINESCLYHNYSYYPNFGKPIVKNNVYTLGNTIIFELYNKHSGFFIDMTVNINEYIINISDCSFWNCSGLCDFSNNKIEFHNQNKDIYGNFSFKLNYLSDLNDNNSQINHTFYSLTSQKIFNLSMIYKDDDELELINFNTKENFFIYNNSEKLSVNYINYKFRLYDMEGFNGELIGLNSSNLENVLENDSYFYVNDTYGLKYKLSPEDKENFGANIKLKMQAYNLFDKSVSKEQEFNFHITIKCLKENNNSYTDNIYRYTCPILAKEVIMKNISELTEWIDANKSYAITGNNCTINISPFLYPSFISSDCYNLELCDKILKENYNKSKSEEITFIQINDGITNEKMAYCNKEKLNFSLCEGILSANDNTDFSEKHNKVNYYYD